MTQFEPRPVAEDEILRNMKHNGVVLTEGANVAEVISDLVEQGYLTVVLIEGVRHYLPSDKGDEYVRLTIRESRS